MNKPALRLLEKMPGTSAPLAARPASGNCQKRIFAAIIHFSPLNLKKAPEIQPSGTDPADSDPTAESRKRDHIDLAFRSQVAGAELDARFYYEPLLAAHPQPGSLPAIALGGKTMRAPIWISSMTGGTEKALTINRNLARACGEFGLGMGLGSCRPLLYSNERLDDFHVRPLMGAEVPLFANLGVAQLETLVDRGELERVDALLHKLDADGLIVHVNPLQEWLQPEGDRFRRPPLETIEAVLAHLGRVPVIVKEVGQGMGYASLKALLQLPLEAIDFAAGGGTNFARLELLRSEPVRRHVYEALALVGHDAADMTALANNLIEELGPRRQCNRIIVSGGVQNFLDGYYYTQKLTIPAVYGQASAFLRYAQDEYEPLRNFTAAQVSGLEVAQAYLRIR